MAVSGKCYLSLHGCGHSANRGECYQLCRRGYELTDLETGEKLHLKNKYLLSPKDLCTIEFMDKIVDSGVKVFKIEGRARSAEYVKRTTSCYRRAADAVRDGIYSPELAAALKAELSEVFNRGFWGGYYQGARMAEWSEKYGSQARRRKTYVRKITNWFDRVGVAEVTMESGSIEVGGDFLVIGSTTGVYEGSVQELRVDLKPVSRAVKGEVCSLPITFEESWKGERKLRRGDRLYLWQSC